MRELDIYHSADLKADQRSGLVLFLCDESAITCRTLRDLQGKIAASERKVVLGIPEEQYKKGLRGWAKVQILASVADKLIAVMPLDYDGANSELNETWSEAIIDGSAVWKNIDKISDQRKDLREELEIQQTSNKFDKEMIDLAKGEVSDSNCWLDAAGSVFVKDKRVLLKSTSQSQNSSRCVEIPINFEDLTLNPGERMIFCDSLHSEIVGISKAAKNGISLKGSTMYVTKFPCRSCAKSVIASGVDTIVFEKGSYGLFETADVVRNSGVTLKIVVTSQPLE